MSDTPLSFIHDRIRTIVTRREWSISTLAKESGIPYSVAHGYVNGKSVTADTLEKIMHAVGIVARPVKRKE